MKRLFTLLTLVLGFLMCHAQDIIVLKNGERVQVKIETLSEDSVTYRLSNYLDGPIFVKSRSDIETILFNSSVATTTSDSPIVLGKAINPRQEITLRRLKVWSKITTIYGTVNFILGGLYIVAAENQATNRQSSDIDREGIYRRAGICCVIEGTVCLWIGSGLRKKRNQLMQEYNIISSVPLFQKEIQLEKVSIAPSVNLMSYRNNPAEGIGAGISVKF